MLRFRNVRSGDDVRTFSKMQRHHILPNELKKYPDLVTFFNNLSVEGFRFDDFLTNGAFLPSNEEGAWISGRAMHCGPHHHYNQLVIKRVRRLANHYAKHTEDENERRTAISRIRLLQCTLKNSLIRPTKRITQLHKRDPYRDYRRILDVDEAIDRLVASRKMR